MKNGKFLLAGMLAVSLVGGGCSGSRQKTVAGCEKQTMFACMDSATMERGV